MPRKRKQKLLRPGDVIKYDYDGALPDYTLVVWCQDCGAWCDFSRVRISEDAPLALVGGYSGLQPDGGELVARFGLHE